MWANRVEPNLPVNEPHPKNDKISKGKLVQDDMAEYVMSLKNKDKESEIEECNRRDWEAVARVVDRFFFVLFAIFILSMVCVIISSLLSNEDTGMIEGFPYIVK